MQPDSPQPVFRFAPSPNGYLHLGHAYSALLNDRLAREHRGRFLLRIEDIDTIRCRSELVDAALEDLDWLGLRWEQPVLRQSEHLDRYRAVLSQLEARGLAYPCFCTRRALSLLPAKNRDPDGSPIYAGTCRSMTPSARAAAMRAGVAHAMRLDLAAALRAIGTDAVSWEEEGQGTLVASPLEWGDVVLGRKETPTSYHLSVVLDDALQGITHVVRGEDLKAATAVHRVLQLLLNLPVPRYRHHGLILDGEGRKLAKSRLSKPLRELRREGISPGDIRKRVGFD